MTPKDFPDSPLGPIAYHRIADFSGSDDPQSFMPQLIGKKKEGAGPVHRLFVAEVQDLFEIGAGQQSFFFGQRLIRHASNREPLASFSPPVGQYSTAPHCGATCPEPVGPFSSCIFGLKSSLHEISLTAISRN